MRRPQVFMPLFSVTVEDKRRDAGDQPLNETIEASRYRGQEGNLSRTLKIQVWKWHMIDFRREVSFLIFFLFLSDLI